MKPLIFASACGLAAAGLAACTPSGPPTSRVALDCPTTQGDLQRTSMAPDQKTCLYTTRDGDEVSLRLVSALSGYQAALEPIAQELQGEIVTDKEAAAARVKAADAEVVAADSKAAADRAAGVAKAAKQAADDALGEAKDAESEAKDASDVSTTTHIDLPGIHIDADESGKADVNVGSIHVNASEHGATVDLTKDVRLRGEALSRERRGFRATYILARDNLKDGWSAVGYVAGGPKVGAITVAVVKAKDGNHHDVLDDVKRLVHRNSGT